MEYDDNYSKEKPIYEKSLDKGLKDDSDNYNPQIEQTFYDPIWYPHHVDSKHTGSTSTDDCFSVPNCTEKKENCNINVEIDSVNSKPIIDTSTDSGFSFSNSTGFDNKNYQEISVGNDSMATVQPSFPIVPPAFMSHPPPLAFPPPTNCLYPFTPWRPPHPAPHHHRNRSRGGTARMQWLMDFRVDSLWPKTLDPLDPQTLRPPNERCADLHTSQWSSDTQSTSTHPSKDLQTTWPMNQGPSGQQYQKPSNLPEIQGPFLPDSQIPWAPMPPNHQTTWPINFQGPSPNNPTRLQGPFLPKGQNSWSHVPPKVHGSSLHQGQIPNFQDSFKNFVNQRRHTPPTIQPPLIPNQEVPLLHDDQRKYTQQETSLPPESTISSFPSNLQTNNGTSQNFQTSNGTSQNFQINSSTLPLNPYPTPVAPNDQEFPRHSNFTPWMYQFPYPRPMLRSLRPFQRIRPRRPEGFRRGFRILRRPWTRRNLVEHDHNYEVAEIPPVETSASNSNNSTSERPNVVQQPTGPVPILKSNYVAMIETALKENGGLNVSGIYQWIKDRYPEFRTSDEKWKNNVRHSLSINSQFQRNSIGRNNFSNKWYLVPKEKQSQSNGASIDQMAHTEVPLISLNADFISPHDELPWSSRPRTDESRQDIVKKSHHSDFSVGSDSQKRKRGRPPMIISGKSEVRKEEAMVKKKLHCRSQRTRRSLDQRYPSSDSSVEREHKTKKKKKKRGRPRKISSVQEKETYEEQERKVTNVEEFERAAEESYKEEEEKQKATSLQEELDRAVADIMNMKDEDETLLSVDAFKFLHNSPESIVSNSWIEMEELRDIQTGSNSRVNVEEIPVLQDIPNELQFFEMDPLPWEELLL